jgi:MutS2 family protein
MLKKSIYTLEFDKIIQMLCQNAKSIMGKELCNNILPSTDIKFVSKMQNETTEAVSLILKKNYLPLGSIKDIRNILTRTQRNGVLSCEELISIADFLYVSEKLEIYSKNYSGILTDLFSKINCALDLRTEIESKIHNNEILDNASQSLFALRKNIKDLNYSVKEFLNSIIKNSKSILQDNIIVMKNNRYCLAVKNEYKNSFNGIVHDQSSSGSTLFIEPSSIVTLNNKIKKLKMDEEIEINKILEELSNKVALNFDLLNQNVYAIGKLDFIFARAQLSISMKASEPILNCNGYINLKKARHPLINPQKVVPLDIYLGDKFTTLLITGPNTGGKTVSLKTVGLLTIMAQSGLHIPANENSQIAVFENIFVDIGDEQSIEQNLSTFSAHMKNISEITKQANENSLILLDELGSGTDPVEGSALAISILEYFFCLKSRVLVTSHYSELKLYAMITKGVENASCEFDLENLSPTYKLSIGTPGKSNAFEISQKIGLDEKIIENAKKNLSQKDIQFEDIIKNLNKEQEQMEKKKANIDKLLFEAQETKKRFENEITKLNAKKEKEIARAKKTALEIIDLAKEKSTLLLKKYREKDFKTAEKLKVVIDNEREKLKTNKNIISQNKNLKPIENLNIGNTVFSISMNKNGIVQSLPDANKNVIISIGDLKIKLPISDLKISIQKDDKRDAKQKSFIAKSFDISSEIDVRGCNCDEALKLIDKYIDDAIIAKLDKITIIHGKGTGALRKAIADFLEKNNAIKSFRSGNFGEGELGVTVVQLK